MRRIHTVICCPVACAGRPLPPLFNWLPGELDEVPADIVRKLQVRGRRVQGSVAAGACSYLGTPSIMAHFHSRCGPKHGECRRSEWFRAFG